MTTEPQQPTTLDDDLAELAKKHGLDTYIFGYVLHESDVGKHRSVHTGNPFELMVLGRIISTHADKNAAIVASCVADKAAQAITSKEAQ